jgi:hypothetical protein
MRVRPTVLEFFEVSRDLIERCASIGEPEMINSRSYIVFGTGELFAKLRDMGVTVKSLELPLKSSYPI